VDDDSNLLARAAQGGTAASKYSRLALVSFLCGMATLAGLLLGNVFQPLVYLFLAFIPAIVTGHLARRRIRHEPEAFRNASMARFGMGIGYLGLLLSLFILGALFFGGITFDSGSG